MTTTIRNDVEKQGYAISPTNTSIKGLKVMPLPINVFTYKYDDVDSYNIEFHDEQYDWYVTIPHRIGRLVPSNASITKWEITNSCYGDCYGEGVGYVYLYYIDPKLVTIHSKCVVVIDNGDILHPHKNLNKCNLLIEQGKAVPIYMEC